MNAKLARVKGDNRQMCMHSRVDKGGKTHRYHVINNLSVARLPSSAPPKEASLGPSYLQTKESHDTEPYK
jgi:hypothetical protein